MIFGLDRLAGSTAAALIDDRHGSFVTYAKLVDQVGRLAAHPALAARPVAFLFGLNDIATVLAYLACLEAGAPVALLRADLAADKAVALIELYRPGLVLGRDPGPGHESLPGLPVEAWHRTGVAAEAHPTLAQLLSTSGSTGSPRMVRLTRSAVESNAAAIAEVLRIGPGDRAALNLPLSYSYGLSVLNSHLVAGGSVVLTEQGLTARPLWDRLTELQATSMPGVPYVYQTLHRLGFETLAPASLTVLTQAGGRLADSLVEHFHRLMTARGGRFHVMYGQTEATARIAVLDSSAVPARLGSVGRAIPGGTLSLAPGGTDQREILYSGPNVMLGYAESAEDLALGDALQGRLETGDLGRIDVDGYLWITGRQKRIAKVNGLRINLDEVEALVGRYGPAAAIEAPTGLRIVLEAPGDPAVVQRIRRALAEDLALPPGSLAIECVDALPRSANGKLDRAALEPSP